MESNIGLSPPFIYEARAKVASGYGMWSAPAWSWSYPYGTKCGGEVDAIEQLGRQPFAVNQSAHWCGGSRTKVASIPTPLADAFHIYGAAIYSDHIDFLLDGAIVNTIRPSETGGAWPFMQATSFNIYLDIGSCGSWADCPPASVTAAEMLVDWIRVR